MRPTDRQEWRKDLVAKGYAIDYVDNWQPKVTMYWHTPQLNVNGNVSSEVGTPVPNQPGHPDHQKRLSNRGLLPWPPDPKCNCAGCKTSFGAAWTGGRNGTRPQDVEKKLASSKFVHPDDVVLPKGVKVPKPERPVLKEQCPDCPQVLFATTEGQLKNKLTFHSRKHGKNLRPGHKPAGAAAAPA